MPLPDHRLWVIYSCKSLFDEILIQDPSRSISVFCERRMKKKFRRLECLVSKQPPFTDTSCKHRKRKPRDRRRSHWQTSPSFSSCLFSSAKRTTCNHLNTHEPTFRKGCANNPKDFRRRLRFENAHSRRVYTVTYGELWYSINRSFGICIGLVVCRKSDFKERDDFPRHLPTLLLESSP